MRYINTHSFKYTFISNTRDIVSSGYPHSEKRVENATQRSIFDEIRAIWIADTHMDGGGGGGGVVTGVLLHPDGSQGSPSGVKTPVTKRPPPHPCV